MKKIQMALAALVLTISVAVAQPAAKQQDKGLGRHQKEMAFQKLNLTEDQKAKMKASNESFREKMKALNGNESQSVKELREKQASLAKSHKAEIESILTTEQKAQMAEIKATAHKRMGEMSEKRFDNLKQELSLTDAQVSQLKEKQNATQSQFQAIQNDNSLDRTAKMEKLKALKQSSKSDLEKILTPEQKQKWQGMKKDKMHGKGKHFRKKMQPQSNV